MSIQLAELSREALFEAGEAFQRYTERRPDTLQCPSCGTTKSVSCEECGATLAPRQQNAADFLIGWHAVNDADSLVSFDDGFYDTYFPSLTVDPD